MYEEGLLEAYDGWGRRKKVFGKKASFQVNALSEEYKALFHYPSHQPDELSFQKGDRIEIINKNEDARINWWRGRKMDGGNEVGYLPKMYVTKVRNASKQMRMLPRMINHREVDLKEVIGKGGFATVRRGLWKNREVAVKMISDTSVAEMVQNEAKIIWLLRHPNIISLIGVYALEQEYCLVMEFVKGGSLSEHLKNNFLSSSCIINWALQVAQGMDYLHNHAPIQSILHRDLKSTNVLISEERNRQSHKTLKITDFGLAKQSSQTLVVTNAAGTFEWMAPEVFKDHRVCRESDVWSFGVVFWELLTSQVPYKNFNQFQIVFGVGKNILQLPIPHLCPLEFKQVLEDCWNRDPKQRPDFDPLLKRLKDMEVSVPGGDEGFMKLHEKWVLEIDRQMEIKKTQSIQEVPEMVEGQGGQEYMEKIMGGIKNQYFEIQKMEMELIEKQIYLAVKQMNVGKKKKSKKFGFFTFVKKDLTISKPTGFQHRFKTVVEQTDVSPTFHLQRLRFTEVEGKDSSQDTSQEHEKNKVGWLEGIRNAFNTMVTSTRKPEAKIIANKRISLFPQNSQSSRRPSFLPLSTSQPCLSSSTQQNNLFSSRIQSVENFPFKVEIIQTASKTKVYVTGNNPSPEQINFSCNSIATIASRSSSITFNVNNESLKRSKYASITSITQPPDHYTFPVTRRYHQRHPHNSLQLLKQAQNVTVLKNFFNQLNTT